MLNAMSEFGNLVPMVRGPREEMTWRFDEPSLDDDGETTTNKETKSSVTETNKDDTTIENVVTAIAMSEYVLLPRHRKGFVNLDETRLADTLEKHLAILATCEGVEEYARDLLKDLTYTAAPNNNNKAQLLFTGTGSAIPQKHLRVRMNQLSIFIQRQGTFSCLFAIPPHTQKLRLEP